MKKYYLSLLATAFLLGANAQQQQLRTKQDMDRYVPTNTAKPTVNHEKSVPLWSNTFDDVNDWVFTNTSQPTPYDWVFTTNQGDIPNAAPSLQPFASTTAGDGFALINSDGQPGNVDGDGAIVAEITNAVPINLTGYTNVILRYQHSYRWWQEARGVRVSGDNGATWTEYPATYTVASGLTFPNGQPYPGNQNSLNPQQEVINISSVAGNASQVLVQFYYDDADFWGWYWVVDDVEILEQPLDDIQILNAWFAGENNGGVEYGRTPINHVDDNYFVGAEIYNFGVNDQTNIDLDAVYTQFTYSNAHPLLESDSTVFLENTETPTLAVGSYNGIYTATCSGETGGANFGDNAFPRNFEITDDMYSIDGLGLNPAATENLSTIGTGSFTDSDDGLVLASLYNFKVSDQVSGIRVMLAPGTVEGGDIYGSILDTADFWASNITPLFTTAAGNVSAADITAGYIDLMFAAPITLPAGSYYAAVDLYSNGGTNDIRVYDDQTVPQPFDASAIYISGDASYSNGVSIGVRLLTGTGWIGLEENTLEGVNVYPNPSTGLVNVSNDNNLENNIVVTDLAGRQVFSTQVNTATTFDLSAVGTGVYVVTVSNENGKLVERVVIK
jgi:hypothetical protein